MDKSTHEIRIEHWKEVVRLCQSRPDGQTAKDWLASNGISLKKYYYWLRQIRLEVLWSSIFVTKMLDHNTLTMILHMLNG